MDGSPILYNGPPLIPHKIAPSHAGSGLDLIHGSLGQPKSTTQTVSRSVQPFSQGYLLSQTHTDRQTDHATPSVVIGLTTHVAQRCGLTTTTITVLRQLYRSACGKNWNILLGKMFSCQHALADAFWSGRRWLEFFWPMLPILSPQRSSPYCR